MNKVKARYFDIASCTYGQLLDEMEAWRRDGVHHYACFCDANGLAYCRRDLDLREAYRVADAVLADGSVTKALAWVFGGKLPERVIGPYLFPKAMAYGIEKGWRHFFYGAAPGTVDLLADKMRKQYPGVQIVGTLSPPFGALTAEQDEQVRRQIEAAKPDILWVALGCPKQEKWTHDHVGKIEVPMILPVGAVFDFYSGRIPHAPDWVHPLGLRWLWRLLTGGKRTFKRNAWCVPRAAGVLVMEYIRIRVLRQRISDKKL
jgi:N-acetylglucosaminyldiphosphoundecaprenol N-acetyl-beta-D-mannosaminyltransferase